jgi:hypothetical protein
MSCGGGNYKACTLIIQDVMDYANKFGDQLSGMNYDPNVPHGPAILGFSTRKYEVENLDVFPGSISPTVNKETLRAQEKLTKEYFALIEDIKYIDDKIKAGMGNPEYDNIRDKIEKNIAILISAIEKSAEYPDTAIGEAAGYYSAKINYQDPTSVKVPTELFSVCLKCQRKLKLTENNGKYCLFKDGPLSCSRCKSNEIDLEAKSDDAVLALDVKCKNGLTWNDTFHIMNKLYIPFFTRISLSKTDFSYSYSPNPNQCWEQISEIEAEMRQ